MFAWPQRTDLTVFGPEAGRTWLRLHPFRLAAICLALVVIAPLFVLSLSWTSIDVGIWQHLIDTQLPRLFKNTLMLLLGVATGVTLLGVSLAWLTAVCDFPGRRFFSVALVLPLAIPAYVMAFVMVALFDYAGPVQQFFRSQLALTSGFSFRGTLPVILVMTLVLYPYVYLLARSAFLAQGRDPMNAARTLGLGPVASFLRVVLPMARPAIVAGMALALMETLADFGAVAVFNYDTFTTAIYKAWYGFFNLQAAAQLASCLLLMVLIGLYLERRARDRARYNISGRPSARLQLQGWRALAALAYCSLVFLVAFAIPVIQLLLWIVDSGWQDWDQRYFKLMQHTLGLAITAALLTLAAAILLGLYQRFYSGLFSKAMVRSATLGYAMPGSVLAVGIMLSFNWLDELVAILQQSLGMPVSPWFVGGVGALLLAYCTRFLAAAFGPVESSLERIKPSIGEMAAILGAGPGETARRIYLPMVTPGLITALLLVLVDVMKEMPATLLMRPFGWDTLAVRIYEKTSEGLWQEAALPGLTIVVISLLPLIILMRRTEA